MNCSFLEWLLSEDWNKYFCLVYRLTCAPPASIHLPYLSCSFPLSFPFRIFENKEVETNLKGQHLDHRSIKWNTYPFPGRQNQCPEAMHTVPRFALPRRVLYWLNIWETFSENPQMGRIMKVTERLKRQFYCLVVLSRSAEGTNWKLWVWHSTWPVLSCQRANYLPHLEVRKSQSVGQPQPTISFC